MNEENPIFTELVRVFGSQTEIARVCDVSRSAVSLWRTRKIPIPYLRKLSKLSGIPASELRPDLSEYVLRKHRLL